MEHDQNIREEFEKLINSKYASHLLNERILEVVKNKWKRLQWFIYLLIGVFTYLNVEINIKSNEVDELKKKLEKVLSSVKQERDSLTLDFSKKLAEYSLNSSHLETRLEAQEENIENVNKYYDLYYKLFNSQLDEVIDLKNKTRNNIAAYNKLNDTINKKVDEYYTIYSELKSLQNFMNGKIDSIGDIALLNKTNSAIRYVHAERSDRYKSDLITKLDLTLDEYKPSTIVLPGTSDTLTFVFYKAKRKGRIKKTVQIDVFRNNLKLPISPLEIEENRGIFTPSNIELPINEEVTYQIEPVFIYLPPNIGGALIIPDFVILKISFKQLATANKPQ